MSLLEPRRACSRPLLTSLPVCPAPREVRAAQTDAPGGEEEPGGEKAGAGGGDERLQPEEGCGRDVDGTGAARRFAALQKGQGQEEVSRLASASALACCG